MCACIVVMCMMASVRKHWWYYVMAPLVAESPGVLTVVMVVCLSGYAICTFGCEYMCTPPCRAAGVFQCNTLQKLYTYGCHTMGWDLQSVISSQVQPRTTCYPVL